MNVSSDLVIRQTEIPLMYVSIRIILVQNKMFQKFEALLMIHFVHMVIRIIATLGIQS